VQGGSKKPVIEDEDKVLEDEVMKKCLDNYETKLRKENEKVLSAASKQEVNTDLKAFEKARENELARERLNLEFYDSLDEDEEDEKESFSQKLKRQMNQIKGIDDNEL
jgi:hypothetical protein